MQKIIYIVTMAAASFCSSCTKQGINDVPQSDKEIMFSTDTGSSITKASSNDDPFLVSAYYKDNSYFDAQSVTLSGGIWNFETPHYWPATVDAANKMEFYAVRKMSSGDTHTFTGKVITVGTALTSDSDIRTAYALVTSVPDGAQNLTFTHDLVKVKFTLKAADQNLVYTVTDMKVTAKKTGTLTLAAAGDGTATRTWAASGDAADYPISGYPANPTTTASTAFGETNVIPQTGVTVSVTYSVATSDGVTVMASGIRTTTIDLSSNSGRTTQYNISLPSGSTEISVTCSVTDWNTQTDVEQGWDVPVTSITLSDASVAVGGTTTLTATVLPENATNKTVTWSSSNTDVATVSASGVVSGIAVGTATITAIANDGSDVKGTCTVKVEIPIYPESGTQGIKIGTTWWAPVNCGYSASRTYGLFYQWGRKYGQTYTGSITPVTMSKSDDTESNKDKFGKYNTTDYNWFSGGVDNTLWSGGSKGSKDPCPTGWRVPTYDELVALSANKSSLTTNTVGGVSQKGYWYSGSTSYSETVLRVFLPAAGWRHCIDSGTPQDKSSNGLYWSSSPYTNDAYAWYLNLNYNYEHGVLNGTWRADDLSVRCVHE